MLKKFLILVFFVLFICSFSFAQQEEITFTTYYPSPYGSYGELDTNYLNFGNIASPPAVGSSCTQAGRTLYSAVEKALLLCDGTSYIRATGGGSSADYDSGWIPVNYITVFPLRLSHGLGNYPSNFRVWLRSTYFPGVIKDVFACKEFLDAPSSFTTIGSLTASSQYIIITAPTCSGPVCIPKICDLRWNNTSLIAFELRAVAWK